MTSKHHPLTHSPTLTPILATLDNLGSNDITITDDDLKQRGNETARHTRLQSKVNLPLLRDSVNVSPDNKTRN
jgi:hypothetical protein